MKNRGQRSGFTIVELLIVVVVIAILAAITIVSYNGITRQAQKTKIASDLHTLSQAIMIGRDQTGHLLRTITGSANSSSSCVSKPTGTDLSSLLSTDPCMVQYNAALNAIYVASGVDVRGMRDPWGRPYFIDENEGEPHAIQPDGCKRFLRDVGAIAAAPNHAKPCIFTNFKV